MSEERFELPTHCEDCGAYLMGGLTRHDPGCVFYPLCHMDPIANQFPGWDEDDVQIQEQLQEAYEQAWHGSSGPAMMPDALGFSKSSVGLYTLIGQTPVPCDDTLEWARWFEHADRRVMSTSILDMVSVSTVFLGIDHSFYRDSPPILFETMAFWEDEPGDCERCETWAEAEMQHRAMVAEVSKPSAVLRYALDQFREWRREAADAWRELRREMRNDHGTTQHSIHNE